MLAALALLALTQTDTAATMHAGDGSPLNDPMRPVVQITRNSATLQYITATPCETRVQVREGEIPAVAFGAKKPVTYGSANGLAGKRTYHVITLPNLRPGKRYFYRIYDPGVQPSRQDKNWGAGDGYRREFAVSTQAPAKQKTIIHLPVKVILMPNVINIESAYADAANPAPLPPKITAAEIQKIKDEFAVSARFLWVNSGMRLWVDHQFFVDERWQRWGPEPASADAFYKGWPASRSYAGQDYAAPGGGDFTILDTKNPLRVTKEPVVEERPFSSQVEMAWPRKWNPKAKKWEFYNSGGGTYGVDSFPQGFPGRSQFLGGGDSAWLATHEVHHQLESHGAFSLSDREDERVVFNHYAPRHRTVKGDGSVDEGTWTTSGRHGEHWDGMAFWDRTLSDAQWLRFYFGYTITVADADQDGIPDNDPRLPLDEKRFGSDPTKRSTNGLVADLEKAMFSTWVPGPLQTSWIKPPFQGIVPDPKSKDDDSDGWPDNFDPYPLYPFVPLIPVLHPNVDGDPQEWLGMPAAHSMTNGSVSLEFKQSHDEAGYYGLITLKGPWKRVVATFDGEGLGVYSAVGVQGFEVHSLAAPTAAAGPVASPVEVKPSFLKAPGLKWKAIRQSDGSVTFEFKLPNRGEGLWYWTRGGREIGSTFTVVDDANRAYSVYEPYRFFYARMLEPYGEEPLPAGAPAEITSGAGVEIIKPGDPTIKLTEGWKLDGGKLTYTGQEERPLYLEGLKLTDFDLLVVMEAKQDAVLGAFTAGNKEMNAGRDYIGFVGGYANTATRMRLFGREVGEADVVMTPGIHRVQLTRRDGDVWLLMDGKPLVWSADPNTKAVIDRLAVIGGYGGNQVVHEIRIRR